MTVQDPEVRPSALPAEQVAQPPGQRQGRDARLTLREFPRRVPLQDEPEELPRPLFLPKDAERGLAPRQTVVGPPQDGLEGEVPRIGPQRGVRFPPVGGVRRDAPTQGVPVFPIEPLSLVVQTQLQTALCLGSCGFRLDSPG